MGSGRHPSADCIGQVDGQRLEKDELPLQLVSTAKISISGCYVM
jgi:hypothetical protein